MSIDSLLLLALSPLLPCLKIFVCFPCPWCWPLFGVLTTCAAFDRVLPAIFLLFGWLEVAKPPSSFSGKVNAGISPTLKERFLKALNLKPM